jgi:hypothetical protein
MSPNDAVPKSYVDQAVNGVDWREPVDKPIELANLDDPNGTTRLCLWNNHAYVKDGPHWCVLAMAGDDDTNYPPPVSIGAVDRLAEIAREGDQNG